MKLVCLNILFVFISSVIGCTPKKEFKVPTFSEKQTLVTKPIYIFTSHPLHNPQLLFENYKPLIDLLNKKISSVQFELEASDNYEDFEKKLYSGRYHFALPNPIQTINATKHGYKVLGKVSRDSQFKGIFLVNKESKIVNISDLKKFKKIKISYPSATALAACIMPQWLLYKNGINILSDVENLYVGSQESSIMNIASGNVDIGVTWPPPWNGMQKKHPEITNKLKVIWETPSLINNGLVVRDDVPQDVANEFAEVLFSLHKTEEGRAILSKMEYNGFEKATINTYKPVIEFVKKFEKHVRKTGLIYD